MSESVDLIQKLGFKVDSVYKLYPAKGDTRSVNIGAFQGNASFTIWDSNQRGAPVQNIPFSREMVELFNRVLKKLLESQPNTTLTIEKPTYVKEGDQGKYVKDIFFKFHKNDKQTYSLEIASNKLSTPVVCSFRTSAIDMGNGELDESAKSALAVKAFITFLTFDLPTVRVISMFNPKPRKFNNGGGGGSYNAPNSNQRYTNSGGEAY